MISVQDMTVKGHRNVRCVKYATESRKKGYKMWVVFMVAMALDILYFMVLCVLVFVCAVVIILALIALSVFVPTLIRTIKEELKKK